MEHRTACAFCDIIAGRTESSVIFADDLTVAFVDLRQPGWPRGAHVLVVPRRHVEFVHDLTDDVSAGLMRTAVRVARSVNDVAAPGGISVWSSSGAAAGQEVPHVHLHVLARYPADGLLTVYRDSPEHPAAGQLAELAASIRDGFVGTDEGPPPG